MANHIITVHSEGDRFVVGVNGKFSHSLILRPAVFETQSVAEHFADGVALGLRLAGHAVRIDIVVPEECGGVLEYLSLCGMRVTRNGRFRSRCPKCGQERDTTRSNLICDAIVSPSETVSDKGESK